MDVKGQGRDHEPGEQERVFRAAACSISDKLDPKLVAALEHQLTTNFPRTTTCGTRCCWSSETSSRARHGNPSHEPDIVDEGSVQSDRRKGPHAAEQWRLPALLLPNTKIDFAGVGDGQGSMSSCPLSFGYGALPSRPDWEC